jgi:hypothetical protein
VPQPADVHPLGFAVQLLLCSYQSILDALRPCCDHVFPLSLTHGPVLFMSAKLDRNVEILASVRAIFAKENASNVQREIGGRLTKTTKE